MKTLLVLFSAMAVLGCKQKSSESNPADVNAEAQIPASTQICDSASNERAVKLEAWAIAGFENGVLTKNDSEKLKALSFGVKSCYASGAKFLPSKKSSENLEQVKARFSSGLATQYDVLNATLQVSESLFCESSVVNIIAMEEFLQKLADSGAKSIVDFATLLQKRVNLTAACGSAK